VHERFVQPTETDFTPDVVTMCNQKGVKMIVMVHEYASMARVARAVKQQNCAAKIEVPNYGANAYDSRFIQQAGDAAEGVLLDQQLALYAGEDAGAVPEVALMLQWVKRVDASFKPDLYTAVAWASGRLFGEAHDKVSGELTRESMNAALKTIDNFDANGMLAPAGPGSKRPPTCWLLLTVKGGKFERVTPATGFRCDDGGYFRL
jgi:hypothetical protein